MKNEKEEKGHEGNDNLISLTFIVNGKEINIEKVNIHQPLKVSVEKALEKSGNTGRDLSDWLVKWNDRDLDISRKVEEFNFPPHTKIFISLKSGKGGNR
jgi:hypothetical protein